VAARADRDLLWPKTGNVVLASLSLPALLGVALPAAAESSEPAAPPSGELDLSRTPAKTPARSEGTYAHTFAELGFGKGFRLNNPYRLATPLGDQPESVSWSAGYLDLGAGVAFGPPDFLQHGGEISLSIALDGIAQETLTLSYLALLPLGEHALLRGRAGMPIVIEPDANVGFELAAGGAWLITGGLGVSAELVGSLFYGAATLDKPATAIPLLCFELGIWADYEVLP
jgi:hypothetical protein